MRLKYYRCDTDRSIEFVIKDYEIQSSPGTYCNSYYILYTRKPFVRILSILSYMHVIYENIHKRVFCLEYVVGITIGCRGRTGSHNLYHKLD